MMRPILEGGVELIFSMLDEIEKVENAQCSLPVLVVKAVHDCLRSREGLRVVLRQRHSLPDEHHGGGRPHLDRCKAKDAITLNLAKILEDELGDPVTRILKSRWLNATGSTTRDEFSVFVDVVMQGTVG